MKRLLVCLLLVGVVGCGLQQLRALEENTEAIRIAVTLNGHSGAVMCVSFSPDGRRIVSGSLDKTLKIWDAQTGQLALTLNGHSGPVMCVSFSPDGRRILSGSGDKTLKIWDAEP